MTRRTFIAGLAALRDAPYNAAGERVGEVTAGSAIVHARLTAQPLRNDRGYTFPIDPHSLNLEDLIRLRMPDGMNIPGLEGSCAGRGGKARLLYNGEATNWVEIGAATDFTHQFALTNLKAATRYEYALESTALAGGPTRRGAAGIFHTAPDREQWAPVEFAVISCQDYACRDDMGGFRTYRSIRRLNPAFLVSTGDNVYYDHDLPFATTVDLARFHWHRMYSQPLVKEVFASIPGYWMKDDHDSFEDDDWPSRPAHRVAPMAYSQLAPVFREQVPMGPKTYRSFRWGKGLEIFLVEGRDFRSPNPDPDGPQKTIWGDEQKHWLQRAILSSDADYRILISPTCIVGPDPSHGAKFHLPGGGADSCCDGGFATEGSEFRRWIRDHEIRNFLVVNGDRHWQYFSVDPETQVREACCGTITDAHCVKDPPNDPRYHRFVRPKGGFLTISLESGPKLTVRFRDVNGKPVYEHRC